MCFKPKPSILEIPHPEEAVNYGQTLENTSVASVIVKWFDGWKVPEQYWDYWRTALTIHLSLQYSSPAATSSETHEMWLRPEWANPGVIAHEEAHLAYSLLTPDQMREFFGAFIVAFLADELLKKALESE